MKKKKSDPSPNESLEGASSRNKKRNLGWQSDLDTTAIGPYLIVPLTTSKQLREEGHRMKHCVGKYDEKCMQGQVRVFSVLDWCDHRRIATLSLIWRDDYWHLEQVKGYGNAEVLGSVETFFNLFSSVTPLATGLKPHDEVPLANRISMQRR